jgi:hypothetical protein
VSDLTEVPADILAAFAENEEAYVDCLTEEFHTFVASLKGTDAQIKKQIKTVLKRPDPMHVVEFDLLSETHPIRFILTLVKSNGNSPVFSSYNTYRAGLNHLFRMYSKVRPSQMELEYYQCILSQ